LKKPKRKEEKLIHYKELEELEKIDKNAPEHEQLIMVLINIANQHI
jgi:hypothetical protein